MLGPINFTNCWMLSGPRLFAIVASISLRAKDLAIALPMFPAPMIPMLGIFSSNLY
jgi:hypothetical protein